MMRGARSWELGARSFMRMRFAHKFLYGIDTASLIDERCRLRRRLLYGGFYNLKPPSSESLPLKEGGAKRRKIEWLAEPQFQHKCRERKRLFSLNRRFAFARNYASATHSISRLLRRHPLSKRGLNLWRFAHFICCAQRERACERL